MLVVDPEDPFMVLSKKQRRKIEKQELKPKKGKQFKGLVSNRNIDREFMVERDLLMMDAKNKIDRIKIRSTTISGNLGEHLGLRLTKHYLSSDSFKLEMF